MNNSLQAKNGFKTFILTLIISLSVFGAIYYLASYKQSTLASVEDTAQPLVQGVTTSNPSPVETTPVTAAAPENEKPVSDKVAMADSAAAILPEEEVSVFGGLAKQKMNVPQREVLAGMDVTESTATPVPTTGITEITYGLLTAVILSVLGGYFLVASPRKRALKTFEDRITRNL